MKKIIVATDFSPGSLNATKYAIELAKNHKATLMIVHAYESPLFYTSDMPLSTIEDAERISKISAENALKEYLNLIQPSLDGQTYQTTLQMGLAGSVVAEQAEKWQADLIIASTSSATKMEQMIIGNTITHIINKAPCMVMVIPPKSIFKPYKRAVFATDMREDHIREVIQAEDLLVPMNTELDFLFIDAEIHSDNDAIDERMSHLVKQQVWYGNRTAYVSTDTDIEAGIQSFIKETNADLAIMVTEHRKFPSMLFHQSITKKMVKHPGVPLLILHPTHQKLPVA
jgi:nucleotide-binding universal stress UspA family protein